MRLYLDIETTGLWPGPRAVTVVGALKETRFVQLVQGQNLTRASLLELFSDATQIIGFNSRRFDVPFLARSFEGLCFPAQHRDLMYEGWAQGLKGGLKALERHLGIARNDSQTTGRTAVWLWQRHTKGDPMALPKLLAYNREDVLNLPVLAQKLAQRAQEKQTTSLPTRP